jgi:hypothetical protein
MESQRYTLRRELEADTESQSIAIDRLEGQLEYANKEVRAKSEQIEVLSARLTEKE